MKNISIRVNRASGEFIKEWTNATFNGFTKEINSGLGECLITLGEKIDYSGGELEVGNIVDILIADNDTKIDGFIKIYSGYISMIEPTIDGHKESIIVHVLGHYTKLSLDILKDGNQVVLYSDTTTGLKTTSPASNADSGLVLRAVIERYREETANPIIYSNAGSIPTTGENILYKVALKKYKEAIDTIISMYPAGYFWYCDENGLFSAKQKPTTPTHTFEFKKHFKAINIERSLEKVRNFLIVWNGVSSGGIFKSYKDDVSISKYGRRSEIIIDYGVENEDTADIIGSRYIEENSNPIIKLTCQIIDNNKNNVNGYDIEKINPGDTCRFIGFDPSLTDILEDNMLITKVDYKIDFVNIEIELKKGGVIDWQEKTAKKLDALSSYDCPETYI